MSEQSQSISPNSPKMMHDPLSSSDSSAAETVKNDDEVNLLINRKGWPIAEQTIDPADISQEHIAWIAKETREKYGFDPSDRKQLLREIVLEMGGKIRLVKRWSAQFEKLIEVRGIDDFTVFLFEDSGCNERRLDMAQAIGHYKLHYGLRVEKGLKVCPGGFAVSRFHQDDPAGKEATLFATEFMLPYAMMKREINNLGRINDESMMTLATKLAAEYRVPGWLAVSRAKSFCNELADA